MSAPTYDLGTLHGGLRLPGHKTESTQDPIHDIPVPKQLVLPIAQHVGDPAQPIVDIGEQVLKGQLIAEADGSLGAPVHASSSGKVVAIGSQSPNANVDLTRYAGGRLAMEMGAVGTGDMTAQAAIVKLMYLAGTLDSSDDMREALQVPIAGELTA